MRRLVAPVTVAVASPNAHGRERPADAGPAERPACQLRRRCQEATHTSHVQSAGHLPRLLGRLTVPHAVQRRG
jgi:hypothetical protein